MKTEWKQNTLVEETPINRWDVCHSEQEAAKEEATQILQV